MLKDWRSWAARSAVLSACKPAAIFYALWLPLLFMRTQPTQYFTEIQRAGPCSSPVWGIVAQWCTRDAFASIVFRRLAMSPIMLHFELLTSCCMVQSGEGHAS